MHTQRKIDSKRWFSLDSDKEPLAFPFFLIQKLASTRRIDKLVMASCRPNSASTWCRSGCPSHTHQKSKSQPWPPSHNQAAFGISAFPMGPKKPRSIESQCWLGSIASPPRQKIHPANNSTLAAQLGIASPTRRIDKSQCRTAGGDQSVQIAKRSRITVAPRESESPGRRVETDSRAASVVLNL